MPYTEDTLVQQTTSDYFRAHLNWHTQYAFTESLGQNGLLGRNSEKEVILTRYLKQKLQELNPNLPDTAYDEAIRTLSESSASQTLILTNKEKAGLIRDGIIVTFHNNKGELIKQRLKIIDFETPQNNHFLIVRELWIKGDLYRRRADLVGFVNGIPLLFIECKNVHKNLEDAFNKNIADYKDTIPHIFHHNALIILANGIEAKIGSITSGFEHYFDWKRLSENEPGTVDMETLLKGTCTKQNFLDIVENFISFDNSSGKTIKIIAKNHQYLGVNAAIEAFKERKNREGKLGVFWHTQGSGKSYSMVFFTKKIHRKIGSNFTFMILTDREDLDTQIYKTFAGCELVDNEKDPCRASSGIHLGSLLKEHKAFIFTLIQKFNQEVNPEEGYTKRDDIIVISDEAHRTQYGDLALNMRNALPNASFIGFTGTPLFSHDSITKRVFGDYISTYDFQRAVEDKATVPLYYDARGEKLGIATTEINDKIAEKLEEYEFDDINTQLKLERELKREYHIITATKRLKQIAHDFVEHYSTGWESGKAMLVCIDKVTCVKMYNYIKEEWQHHIHALEKAITKMKTTEEKDYATRQLQWMHETQLAVIVSEEQGEVDKFRKEGLDIIPHRTLIKRGFELEGGETIDVEKAFKKQNHPFRVAIVCAMWLTGFDVPSLSTLYLDKPLKAHTLMQAIARANRVNEGKNNGLIIDYCGILRNLRKALATYSGTPDTGRTEVGIEVDPTKPEQELLKELEATFNHINSYFTHKGYSFNTLIQEKGFTKNALIKGAKEVINESESSRKEFEIMVREMFKKFKACINMPQITNYRESYYAVNTIYKSLQNDRNEADITAIIKDLHNIIESSVHPKSPFLLREPHELYDISKINFKKLKQEFAKVQYKHTTVQNLKDAIEKKLAKMISQNPLRTDFQKHYEQIIDEYNKEKDRQMIEATFQALLDFVEELDNEEKRAMREQLDQETLALYDILLKPDIDKKEIQKIKKVCSSLLETLKMKLQLLNNWRDKQITRDAVKLTIRDFLYSDATGLPQSYTEKDINKLANEVYLHFYRAYETVPSKIYAAR